MKGLNLQLNEMLYAKTYRYAKDRGIPVVGAIRLILSDFFRNNPTAMDKDNELPEGIIDMGKDKGLVIDMAKLRDKNGVVHIPPENLSKEQTLEWIRNYHEGQKNQA